MSHISRQWSCRSLRCSWNIVCRRCSNYIFILYLTHGFNRLTKTNTRRDVKQISFWDLVWLILKVWRLGQYACHKHVRFVMLNNRFRPQSCITVRGRIWSVLMVTIVASRPVCLFAKLSSGFISGSGWRLLLSHSFPCEGWIILLLMSIPIIIIINNHYQQHNYHTALFLNLIKQNGPQFLYLFHGSNTLFNS